MKNVIHVFLLAAALFLFLVTFGVSPYKYEWEPELKQVDRDSVLFLWMIYCVLAMLLVLGWIVARGHKQFIAWGYVLLMFVLASQVFGLVMVK